MMDRRIIVIMTILLFLLGVLTGFLIARFVLSERQAQEKPQVIEAPSSAAKPPAVNNSHTVKKIAVDIYFCRAPYSYNDFTYVRAVKRSTTRRDVAAFAMEQLIKGPTAAERKTGYFTALRFRKNSVSACGSRDFSIIVEEGVAVIRLCRYTADSGVGSDARVTSQIRKTVGQFSTVRQIVILDAGHNCFGDLSGENRCYKDLPAGQRP